MEFLLGLFLGYLLFSKRKNNKCDSVRVVKVTTPIYKKPPRRDDI